MARAACLRAAPRAAGSVRPHAGWSSRARRTAASTSAAVATGTCPITSPVRGSRTSSVSDGLSVATPRAIPRLGSAERRAGGQPVAAASRAVAASIARTSTRLAPLRSVSGGTITENRASPPSA